MLSFRGGQPERAVQGRQHDRGRAWTVCLLEPLLVVRGDPGEPRDLFAAQPGCPSAGSAVNDHIRAGSEDVVTTEVLELSGRPPRSFTDFVRRHRSEWDR